MQYDTSWLLAATNVWIYFKRKSRKNLNFNLFKDKIMYLIV